MKTMNRFSRILSRMMIVLTALALLGPGCARRKPVVRKPQIVPVTVAVASVRDVPIQIQAIGTVEPYTTVAVKSLIEGEILKVHFTEGQSVRKGDMLFSINPKSMEAQVRQARADLARDVAQMENARVQERRFADLVNNGYVARQSYDQTRTALAVMEETVRADSAVLDRIKVQLEYCSVTAPISGRTGSLMVHQGNVARTDTPLVVINQMQPVLVSFSVQEKTLGQIRERMKTHRLPVEAVPSGETARRASGQLSFIDNTVDRSTGMILLKAMFENRNGFLWPGQFVDVAMTILTLPGAVVIPAPAVQVSNEGRYVFLVKPDRSVEKRQVAVTGISETEYVVDRGVKAGETVVTDGHLRIIPGVTVEIKNGAGQKP